MDSNSSSPADETKCRECDEPALATSLLCAAHWYEYVQSEFGRPYALSGISTPERCVECGATDTLLERGPDGQMRCLRRRERRPANPDDSTNAKTFEPDSRCRLIPSLPAAPDDDEHPTRMVHGDLRRMVSRIVRRPPPPSGGATPFDPEDAAFLRRLARSEEMRFSESGVYIPNQIPRSLYDLADRIEQAALPLRTPAGTESAETPSVDEMICALIDATEQAVLRDTSEAHGARNEAAERLRTAIVAARENAEWARAARIDQARLTGEYMGEVDRLAEELRKAREDRAELRRDGYVAASASELLARIADDLKRKGYYSTALGEIDAETLRAARTALGREISDNATLRRALTRVDTELRELRHLARERSANRKRT